MRIRRRFALMLCGVCMLIFLTLYFIINYGAPTEDRKMSYGAIETKLQQLESGLLKHGQEMHHLKSRLERNLHREPKTGEKEYQENDVEKPQQAPKRLKNPFAGASDDTCAIDTQEVPQPDIQMLELYEKMKFDDIDGGVWKQGWNIKYDPLQYNDHHKLKVFVVPHSHNDPGWIKTLDDYYDHDTKNILSNALRHLRENPEMKFIWAEIVYFSRFYEGSGPSHKKEIKKLVKNKQLEFVTGGWVMPDESSSHWLSVLMQLTEGQTWLKQHLNVTPTSSWSIDPFGYSPTMPYILQKSGFQNMLIQRTHYSVKKELAQKKQLEFYWRQLWDDDGNTDLFTHMMPFYSYDIPHTCGPDPKICCQFDFKRIKSFGLSCPWRVAPQPIDQNNVQQKAELLVDQWKKKAELYRTNALLIPLGDDFRFSQSLEWDVQRMNYETLFDHINTERKYFVEAKFGTLQEYFDAVHHDKQQDFPTLSGDFFTYADRADNYWSGYFTSRPYHKRMDRVLLHYVRAAEMLHSWHGWDMSTKFDHMLRDARRELSLFQHHDGIAGTAKTHVMADYARRMLDAVKACRFVMQQSVYRLLTKSTIYSADFKFNYFYVDDSRWPGPDDSRTTIILGPELPTKLVVFHNLLPYWREEVVDFYVSTPFVSVTNFNKSPVQAQVNPVWSWHRHTLSNSITPQASTTKYVLHFKVRVPPMGLATYIINMEHAEVKLRSTVFASNLILTLSPVSINLGDYPEEVKFSEHRELSLRVDEGPAVAFSSDGLMKSIQIDENSPHTPIHLKFLRYGTRITGDRSGAYLFIPNGPATHFVNVHPPVVLVMEGPLESSISVGLPFAIHQTILRSGAAPEIRNYVDITDMEDTEVVMRFSTHIQSGDIFYTDLNGLQMIKRKRFFKLPLQANFYPVPTAIYIEDDTTRLTVLSGQPLGGSSLAQGELEIMQDRRLSLDDERGLGQGVLDNQPVVHIFRVLLEKIDGCVKPAENYPMGALTRTAHRSLKTVLNPIDKFIYAENDWIGVLGDFGTDRFSIEDDLEVVVQRNLETTTSLAVHRDRKQHYMLRTGIIVHRTSLLQCSGHAAFTGMVNLFEIMGSNVTSFCQTNLTLFPSSNMVDGHKVHLCEMDTKAFIANHHS